MTVAFRSSANAPKNCVVLITCIGRQNYHNIHTRLAKEKYVKPVKLLFYYNGDIRIRYLQIKIAYVNITTR